ncbi:hypothetical protein BD626DRAFT_143997 [Schizophyllum amplum]|uniref:Fungal-type protein kinase domain-containing protein n=1 Tax=Schizophyllum amplum TaxID=97359 RepID=A0A550C4W6_9AGAR|nr:hypothetical protein BD626DRAFT_143997 [Auriculariopsis ampla]
MKESADSIRIALQREFLDGILPVDSDLVDAVHKRMVELGVYIEDTQGGQWRGFPADSQSILESQLYEPFVECANAIAKAAKGLAGLDENQVRDAAWVDYHKRSPKFLDAKEALVKPDCLLALAAFGDIMDMDDETLEKEKKKTLFWLQAVAAVEAKRKIDQTDEDVVRQLLGYLRMIMVEQKDRRFALGLAYSRARLSVWLQDRSGVLGMDKAIDMHKEPKKFIQVIAAFAVLPAHRLGFDPTMKLWRKAAEPIHTYRTCSSGPDRFDVKLYKDNNYATQWVIETQHETYLTLKALSLLRTDVVRGSGSIVWAAVPYNERGKHPDERQTVVLKQAWRPEGPGRESEGALYEHLRRANEISPSDDAQYLAEVLHSEDVQIEGMVDNTHDLIQHGLQSAPPELPPQTGTKRVLQPDKDGELLHVDTVTLDDIQNIQRFHPGYKTKDLVKRTHTRIVFNVFGWSIRYFGSLSELIQCLLQCVRGHKLAFEHGVLQCDISPANLLVALICGSKLLKPEALRGCLIDLDHAKRIPIVAERRIAFDEFNSEEVHKIRRTALGEIHVTDDVLRRALQVITNHFKAANNNKGMRNMVDLRSPVALGYVLAAQDYARNYGGYRGGTCDADTLGWNTYLLKPPVLSTTTLQQATLAPRSGTPPYASAMILNPDGVVVNTWQSGLQKRSVLHDAIHDTESFFWVLLYLCITRSGPGGDRRKDLSSDIAEIPDATKRESTEHMRRVVHCLFDGDTGTLAYNKKRLFEEGDTFETDVLIHIHPYFEPLRRTLLQWWELLLLAYEFQGYEYHDIHNRVIALLEQTLRRLAELESEGGVGPRQDEDTMKKKREEFVRRVLHVGWDSKAHASHDQQPSTPPTSPTGLRLSTALANTPESQRQRRSVAAQPVSPSPQPAAKKVRK